jgi:hypothetical protein
MPLLARVAVSACLLTVISAGCGTRGNAPSSLREAFSDVPEYDSSPSEIRKSRLNLYQRLGGVEDEPETQAKSEMPDTSP